MWIKKDGILYNVDTYRRIVPMSNKHGDVLHLIPKVGHEVDKLFFKGDVTEAVNEIESFMHGQIVGVLDLTESNIVEMSKKRKDEDLQDLGPGVSQEESDALTDGIGNDESPINSSESEPA